MLGSEPIFLAYSAKHGVSESSSDWADLPSYSAYPYLDRVSPISTEFFAATSQTTLGRARSTLLDFTVPSASSTSILMTSGTGKRAASQSRVSVGTR